MATYAARAKMRRMPNRSPFLSSDEIAILAGKARAFHAMAELLAPEAGTESLADARSMLAGSSFLTSAGGALARLRASMASTDVAELAEERARFHDGPLLACTDQGNHVHDWACVVAEVVPDDRRSTDLRVLGTLTDLLSWRARTGHQALARAIEAGRVEFLEHHAGACLMSLARDLRADLSVPHLSDVGHALQRLLEREPIAKPPYARGERTPRLCAVG